MHIETLAKKLGDQHWILATAESCTGGLLAAKLTEMAGASTWFDRSLVTYSNEAKQQLLNVSPETLHLHGAVSEACALEMLKGLFAQKNISVGIAITGIAGPDGGSPEKPVGTVWFAFGIQGKLPCTVQKHFSGNRQAIREQACEFAIECLINLLSTK